MDPVGASEKRVSVYGGQSSDADSPLFRSRCPLNKTYASVLIDDRIKFKADWEAKGGIFIHHTDTTATLRQLQDHGILPKATAADVTSGSVSIGTNSGVAAAPDGTTVTRAFDPEIDEESEGTVE